ncbi:MAG: hypothetical protein WC810_26615 [Janthinobacterium sp.]|jgi:hypothetical protein
MALTVNTAFAEFHDDKVNLVADRTDKARRSRDWLILQLNGLSDNKPGFPVSYPEKHNKYGSFARRTKIRELDDVDLIYCMSATGATYYKDSYYQNIYDIHTTNAGAILTNLAPNNILNSNKVIEKVRSSLLGIEHYSEAKIHKKNEAVTLKLSSYEWNFDILPSFFTDTEYYLIPDGNGRWKATNPNIDQARTTDTNQKFDGRVLQIIRTLKYWSRYKFGDMLSSYLFEVIIIDYLNNRTSISEWIDYTLHDFWAHLAHQIYQSVWDPKNFDGNINSLSFDEQRIISRAAQEAHDLSVTAIYAEVTLKDHEASIKSWRKIFGNSFPTYG